MSSGSKLVRYERLELVCRKALEQVIKRSLTLDQVKMIFPDLANCDEGMKALINAQEQVVSYWLTTGIREFEYIFKELDIKAKLDALDEVIERAKERRRLAETDPMHIDAQPVAIDLLPAQDIFNAYVTAEWQPQLQRLRAIDAKLRDDNEKLSAKIEQVTAESTELLHRIELISADFEKQMLDPSQLHDVDIIEKYVQDSISKDEGLVPRLA